MEANIAKSVFDNTIKLIRDGKICRLSILRDICREIEDRTGQKISDRIYDIYSPSTYPDESIGIEITTFNSNTKMYIITYNRGSKNFDMRMITKCHEICVLRDGLNWEEACEQLAQYIINPPEYPYTADELSYKYDNLDHLIIKSDDLRSYLRSDDISGYPDTSGVFWRDECDPSHNTLSLIYRFKNGLYLVLRHTFFNYDEDYDTGDQMFEDVSDKYTAYIFTESESDILRFKLCGETYSDCPNSMNIMWENGSKKIYMVDIKKLIPDYRTSPAFTSLYRPEIYNDRIIFSGGDRYKADTLKEFIDRYILTQSSRI